MPTKAESLTTTTLSSSASAKGHRKRLRTSYFVHRLPPRVCYVFLPRVLTNLSLCCIAVFVSIQGMWAAVKRNCDFDGNGTIDLAEFQKGFVITAMNRPSCQIDAGNIGQQLVELFRHMNVAIGEALRQFDFL